MDADTLVEIAKQVPALLILGWVVLAFLKAMSRRDDTANKVADNCHLTQRDAIKAMQENSRVLGETSAALERVNNILIKLNGK